MGNQFTSDERLKKVPERTPLFAWGAVATTVYLVVLLVFALNFGTSVFDLKPNELGDFLAGAFSPLAFLWLVLGFLQQGQELRIQAVELNNSVEQSRQLVAVTRDQLELERQSVALAIEKEKELSRPQFRLSGGPTLISGNEVRFKYEITNLGGPCTNVILFQRKMDQPMDELRRVDHMHRESTFDISLKLNVANTPDWHFVLQYRDDEGHPGQVTSRAWYDRSDSGHDVRFQ